MTARPNRPPPTVTITSAGPTSATLHVVVHGMFVQDTVVEGTTYQMLFLPGEGQMGQIGAPQMPQVTKLIGFAPGSDMAADVAFGEHLTLSGFHVFPAQPAATDSGPTHPFTVDSTVYGTAGFFPQESDLVLAHELGVCRS